MKERITYLDTAKGTLILMMLVGHIWNDGIVHDFIYVFHMPAFFIISGITSSNKALSLPAFGKFLVSRIRSLIIPYLFFELYAILIDIACNGAYLNWKGYAYQILTVHLTNGPLWFLITMFYSSVIFYFLQGFTVRKGKRIIVLFFFVLALIMPQRRAYDTLCTATLAILYMMIGFLCKDILLAKSPPQKHLSVLFILTFLISFTNIGEMPNYQSGSRTLFLLGSLIGTMFILGFSKLVDCKHLQFFGQNSLVILGSHYPIIRVVKHLFRFEEFSAINGMIFLALLIPFEVLIIHFINRFLPFAAGKRRKANI